MGVKTGKLVSILTLWRSLQYCGITRKKVYVNGPRDGEGVINKLN